MSYILDALRRADAERDRGQIPGLHAQPAPRVEAASSARPGRLALGLGGGLMLALAAGLAWWSWPPGTLPTVVVAPPAPPPARPSSPPPVAALAPPAVAPAPAPTPLPRVVSAPPTPAPSPPAAVAGPAESATPAAERTAPASSAPRVLTLAEMTPEQRRDWPRLAIGGVVHSDHAASRFVLIEGRLVHEGEEAAPGVTVERIGARAAILRWRGLRVELPF